jgi:NB-ARC domain/WD domain, G-beta repeat/Trypsin-like peptidase domain
MSEQLKPAIVRIYNPSDEIVGGGFLVSERHIITCAHVVNLAIRRTKSNTDKPDGEITLDFPLIAPDRKLKAKVMEWFPEEEFPNLSGKPQGIAVLELKEDPPESCAATPLVFGDDLWKHDCRAFGFAKSQGRWVPVIARDEVAGRWIQVESDDTEYALEPGFSGTAVWDDQLDGVVGMVVAGEAKQEVRAKFESPDLAGELISHRKLPGAFLIPTSVLVEAWPELRNRVRPQRPAINMAEPPPDDFVARDKEFNQLSERLLDPEREKPVAIGATAALRGAGGYGKTTLARAVCHQPQIQSAFKDGILWVTIGETPGNLAAKLDDLTYALSGKKPGSESIEAATTEFKKQLEGREILIVVDDVWAGEHLRPFLQGGRRCARLITTRIQNVIPPNAHKVEVDAMRIGEAVELLAAGFENDPDRPGLDDELRGLAKTLGEWPLLLKLANGALRNRVANGDSFRDALDFIKADLDENGLTTFDSDIEEERNRAVSATLGVSFKLLKESDLARFNELAVYPEDVNALLATVEKFWSSTGNLSRVNAQKLCERLHSLSLLLNFSLKEKRILLHDVIRKYLIEQQRERLPEIHAHLLDALSPHRPSHESPAPAWSEMPDEEPYLWDHLAFHLIEAQRGDQLVATVKDWRYLAKKTLLKKSLSVEGDLVKAEKVAPADDPLRTLRRNYVNSGHLFNRCKTGKEVNETIYVRLQHLNDLKTILREMAQNLELPYFAPQYALPDLPHPALIRTLEGHSTSVIDCAVSPDGQLIVSASSDRTLKVWDALTGQLLRTLEGHSDSVSGCAFSPGGQLIVSASYDSTLKVWDAESGKFVAVFYADGQIYCCVLSSDNVSIVAGGMRGVYFLRLER